MKKFIIIATLCLPSLRAPSQEMVQTVPIRLVDNLIFLELHVNDSNVPLNFLFDSGAGVTVIDTKIAEQLSIDINAESKINTSGKSLLSKESTSNTLIIGENITIDNINLVLMDLSHLNQYFKTNIDGVIGFDLLNKFVVETNIDEKEFRFYAFKNFMYSGKSEPLDLITLESNLFGIMIDVKQKNKREPISLNFEIDTGADNYLTFHNKTVSEYQLINENKKQRFRNGFGADSTITKNVRSKIKSVSFGGKNWQNIPVILEVDSINSRDNSIADGLIGQELLLDFNITYNLMKRLIYFEERK